MIVTPGEVRAFAAFLDQYEEGTAWDRAIARAAQQRDPNASPEIFAAEVYSHLTSEQMRRSPRDLVTEPNAVLAYLRSAPHLLIPVGFDEIRVEPEPARRLAEAFWEESERRGNPRPDDARERLPGHEIFEFMLGVHARDAATGVWYRSASVDHANFSLSLHADGGTGRRDIPLRNIVRSCERAIQDGSHPAALLLPNLWLPPSAAPNIEVANAARNIVFSLQRESLSFSDLTWQQLEDVVSELLKHHGYEIQATRRSADGGRDLFARGELVPGEVAMLAVEVKHKPVVKVGELREHLYANKEFPLLLVATSGRFSAGVVREKTKPENFLRLQLRDGEALKNWIHGYR